MRINDDTVLDDAVALLEDHSWRTAVPCLDREHVAELVAVLAPLFQRSRPKVQQQKRERAKKAPVDRGSQKLGRDLVYGRSDGRCEAWIPGVCIGMAREWHHRLNRSQGGRWDASNGLHLCKPCHAYVTDKARDEAKAKGWAVAPGITSPIEVPVLRRGVWVLLDDEGGMAAVEQGSAA